MKDSLEHKLLVASLFPKDKEKQDEARKAVLKQAKKLRGSATKITTLKVRQTG